jgi:hypothetical protein
MRKAEFEVPAEVFGDFTEKLSESGLDNRVLGRTEDDEIEVEVYYEKSDVRVIDELEEYLEELKENLESEEEEEEDEDN